MYIIASDIVGLLNSSQLIRLFPFMEPDGDLLSLQDRAIPHLSAIVEDALITAVVGFKKTLGAERPDTRLALVEFAVEALGRDHGGVCTYSATGAVVRLGLTIADPCCVLPASLDIAKEDT